MCQVSYEIVVFDRYKHRKHCLTFVFKYLKGWSIWPVKELFTETSLLEIACKLNKRAKLILNIKSYIIFLQDRYEFYDQSLRLWSF